MSIRLRLTAWCAAIFCALFIGLTIITYVIHARAQYRDVDETLAAMTTHNRSEIERQLASGAPLNRSLVASIDVAGQELAGAELTVYDAADNVIIGRSIPKAAPTVALATSPPHDPAMFLTVDTPDGRVRVHTMPLTNAAQTVGYVQTSISLAALDRSLARLRLLLMAAMAGGLIIALAGSLTTAAHALRPIADMTETARAITLSRSFGSRLEPTARSDELGELTRTFNEMLSSLDEAHQRQQQFVDDAAHELRAPLTSIIGNLELLDRAHDLPASEQQAVVSDALAEAERLGRLVSGMLMLARADGGQRVVRARVELDRLTVDVVRLARPRASGVRLVVSEIVPAVVPGDADQLRQLLVILVENAMRYTPGGGNVSVALRQQDGEAVLSVRDTGVGISAADLPRIFDRFYRADPTRSRVVGGSGLGLAIAKWIAEAHDGRIEVESRPGTGSTFTVVLPLADPGIDSAKRNDVG